MSATPVYGFDYQFALPTDPFCLRVLAMEFEDYVFKVEKKIKMTGDSEKDHEGNFLTGTNITFLPSTDIFSNIDFI